MNGHMLKQRLASVAVVVGLIVSTAHAGDTELSFARKDHQLHSAGSAGATIILGQAFKANDVPLPTLNAALAVFVAGVAKEGLVDNAFSVGDIKANSAGIAAGSLVNFSFRF